ncbi:MAG TPA: GTPase Era [Hyphomicrobiaceae bacterium]|jgi:GTP-binding protein Era
MAEPEATRAQVPESDTRCGFIAVIGAPNAGKSTLVNALVGAKVTIVSRKVQTTRIPVRGIVVDGQSQIVFLDTPGIFRPRRRLDRAMVEAAWAGALDADIVVLLVDAVKGVDEDVERILQRLGDAAGIKVLALNKVDRLAEKHRLLELTADLTKRVPFERVFMVSALTGSGLKDLKDYLVSAVPPGPWHYPPDELSDLTDRKLAAEITREKIYERLHEELPYSVTVETTDWQTRRDGSARVEQTIFVERESQRKIVLGKGGATIKQISMEARKELAKLLGHEVHLFLHVKVRENWADDPERYREMGLEFPKE